MFIMGILRATIIVSFLLCSTTVFAVPTTPNRQIIWEHAGIEPDLAGFYLYVAPQSATPPRTYDDTARYQIADPLARQAILIDLDPASTGGLCFQMTAYDTSGNESDFSNEACGWFGMSGPFNLGVIP